MGTLTRKGDRMAFGFKLKTIKTKNSYANNRELFERIKDEEFEAGAPKLAKNGFTEIIVFPPLDRQNQIWVMMAGKNKIQVQKSELVGAGNMAANEVLEQVTGGIFGMKSIMGKNAKHIEQLVVTTADELEALDL
jgi:hypothetical protein